MLVYTDFFFDAECPDEDTIAAANIARDCGCHSEVAAYRLRYSDPGDQGDITVRFTRKRRFEGGDYAIVTLSDGDEIEIFASALNKQSFNWNTFVFIVDEDGNSICGRGRIRECSLNIINNEVERCEGSGLFVDAWIDNAGFTCDLIAVRQELNSASAEGYYALINTEKFSSPFTVFDNLDPYIKWSLIAILITFIGLSLICCICIIRGSRNSDKEKPPSQVMQKPIIEMNPLPSNSIHLHAQNIAQLKSQESNLSDINEEEYDGNEYDDIIDITSNGSPIPEDDDDYFDGDIDIKSALDESEEDKRLNDYHE